MAFDYSRFSHPTPGKPIAVAEIGTAHGGDLQRGLDLVDAAADSGADVAKLQVVIAEEILPPEAGLVPLPGGPTPLFEVFRKLERPIEFYAALAERAEKRGIGFFAAPFGPGSFNLLSQLGVKAWKVASPELNYEPLLEDMARTGLPIVLSTGVSMPNDIQRALDVIDASSSEEAGAGIRIPVTILHCLTSYPAPEEQANLMVIPAMTATYNRPIGLSDHSLDPVLIPSLAVALGAVMVEKHITLNRTDGGLDDPVALIPEDFARMTESMKRSAGQTLEDSISELSGIYGHKGVESCLGDGIKKLASSEEANYERTNRSLHAVGALTKGTRLGPENTALLRTEKVLRPGLPPWRRAEAYGAVLVRNVPAGEGICEEDFE